MHLNKYEIESQLAERGYSSTAIVVDECSTRYFAKWISGIEKNSQSGQIFVDKLRHLKKATHTSLPQIIEYDWDLEKNSYCTVFEFKEAKTLEEYTTTIEPIYFLRGIKQIVECLQFLQQKHRITHGDITPANILVDDNNDFFLN